MDNDRMDKIIDKYRGDAGSLIQILLDVQSENHWLPKEALEKVSEKLKVPLSRVQHIATFYKTFSVVPGGRHEIHVCNGTSCHVCGSQRVLDAVEDLIGIRAGETDPGLKFSLETVTCLGRCSAGPVIEVDGKHYGGMEPARAKDALRDCD